MLLPLAHESPLWEAYAPVEPVPPPAIGDPGLPLVTVVTPSGEVEVTSSPRIVTMETFAWAGRPSDVPKRWNQAGLNAASSTPENVPARWSARRWWTAVII